MGDKEGICLSINDSILKNYLIFISNFIETTIDEVVEEELDKITGEEKLDNKKVPDKAG